MKTRLLLCGALVALIGVSGGTQTRQTVPYDHIHLAAPNPEQAYDWYVEHLEGQAGENPGRMVFEPFTGRRPLPVQLMHIEAPDAGPSAGGVIHSIGFSFPDVDAKVTELQSAGASVVEPARDIPGLWRQAVVVDPWGVTIELVEDSDLQGFHHIALQLADPDAATDWFASAFGGERLELGGGLDALRYDHTYLLVRQGQGAPSEGRAIDHLGWMPPDLDALATHFNDTGVTFTREPRPAPNRLGHRTAYVESPGGARIELVEHAACAWGEVGG